MATPTPRYDLDRDHVLYLVPYAHLDTQWRWDYRTTIERYLPETIERNEYLFEHYPHYVFNFSGAIRYQMIEEYDPEAFERLREHVAAGRWRIAGCQAEEADAIVPSPESMLRQILYGYRYFQDRFGYAPLDYILPDCFGFPWFLPSVLAHCGLRGFSTQKLTWSSAAGIPFSVGVWEGPDGASVAAALDPGNYVGRVRVRPEWNLSWVRRLLRNGRRTGVWADYRYYGTGDVGGAPKEPSVRTVEKTLAAQEGDLGAPGPRRPRRTSPAGATLPPEGGLRERGVPTDLGAAGGDTSGGDTFAALSAGSAPPLRQIRREITVHQGSSDQLFRDLTAAQRARLPRYSGDLLLTRHSAGSLTSQAMIKRWNRKNELLADAAERLAVIAASLGGAYPVDVLRKAWLRVLGSQMHDILPGTSLPRCYDYAHNDETVAANALAGVLVDAAGVLASGMDTTCPEGAVSLLVYNPLAFPRQEVVEATVPLPSPAAVRVTGPEGEAVPAQILSRGETETRILFLADLPACGAAVWTVAADGEATGRDTELRVDRRSLENGRYRITLNEAGQVASIVDKGEDGCELLSRPIEHQFLREHPRIFPAWNMEWKDRRKPPYAVLGGPAEIEVVESGPVRVAVRITRTHGDSRFEQVVRLACGEAGDRIEFADTIDWRERGCSLKAAFAFARGAPEAAYNWELGVIRRGNNDPDKFEVPAHRWFDLSDAQGGYGVTVLEDCKYGSDKPADDVLRLTLLFTPRIGPLEVAFRDQGSQDWGRHRMLYGLYGHRGDWREGRSEQQSLRLNVPPLAFRVVAAPGPLGRTYSFLELDSEQVAVRAIKRAEERETVIVRLQELWGRECDAVTVRVGNGVTAAWETDGCERRLREAKVRDGCLVTRMGPYALQTFELQLALCPPPAPPTGGREDTPRSRRFSSEDGPAYATLDLPYNLQAFTGDNERGRGGLPGGRSFPREHVPARITCGGVPLEMAVEGEAGAVSCRGQAIVLPEGGYDTLLLLASADEDTEATFSLDGTAHGLRVQAGEGFVGQWDRRIWDRPMEAERDYIWRANVTGIEPGYIVRDRIGWYTTHMHSREGNEPYAYGYAFLYAVPLPAGVRRLTLPDAPGVRVYAATACRGALIAEPAAALYDEVPFRSS